MSFLSKIAVGAEMAIFSLQQFLNFFNAGCISPFAALPLSLKNIEEKGRKIQRKLNFTEEEIQQVEKKTRLQSRDSDWYLYRKGRITASKCKRVASLKPTTLKELFMINKVPQTSAMLQGLEMKI